MGKLNISESEKNRIKNLHKSVFLKEQDINVVSNPVGSDPMGPMDPILPNDPISDPADPLSDNPILQADNDMVKGVSAPKPQSGIPCQSIMTQMQAATGVPSYWQSPLTQQLIPSICNKCNTHYNAWVSNGSPNAPLGTGDWAQYGQQGQQICLMLIANPQCCTNTTQQDYECVNGQCLQQNGGQYATMQDCNNSGCGDVYCIDCQQGQMTMGPNGVCPQGYTIAPGTPGQSPPSPTCYECLNGVCTGPSWASGPMSFNTQPDCQNSQICQPPTQVECINGSCVTDPNGQFANMTLCQNSGCGQNSFDCTDWTSPSGCQSVGGSGGQFQTLDDCLISPCQCDDIIQTWPLYLNNPNNPQGNWDGSPHDGPNNQNALQNQLNNVQGSNAYNGNNPTQLHKAKCKEAAIIFWLGVSSNILCCSEPTWGNNTVANGGNGDTLGCVTTGFINMMNNFMNNHSGWPNQGCDWLQTRLTNAQTQQSQYPSSSGAYCKIQGKINFLNNFISTASSTYLTGTAVFTPGC
tara:strand:+ start:1403 stop:2965 length:1563 start_codon:yes stop_codon:yes gene_type:complete